MAIGRRAGVSVEHCESIGLYIQKPNNRKIFILCIYKPPTGSFDTLLDFLKIVLDDPVVKDSEVWILGDFNMNFTIRNNPNIMSINRFLKENNLQQLINEPTRLTNRGGTCLDWIITNCRYVSSKGVLNDLISDHFPVYAVRKKSREIVERVWKSVRIYKNYDVDHFKNLFDLIDWENFFNCSAPDVLWDILYERIQEILEVMCPYKKILVREEKTLWFTNEIYECIKKRANYVKLFRATGNSDVFEISKYFRNKCNRLIREAKSNYIKNNLDVNRGNPKKFWRCLNAILKDNNSTSTEFEFRDPVKGANIEQSKTCDFLNDFFANVGERKYPLTHYYEDSRIDGANFSIGDVRLDEVEALIKSIDISKDSCVDGVSSSVLKTALAVRPDAIMYMFNRSLEYGVFPRKWAVGYINLLPKGGDKTNPSNWRPITQTCIPAKILEKIVQKRLVEYLEQHDFLSDNQFGFRKGMSTQKTIFRFTTDIYSCLNRDDYMGGIYLDVSKAFDSLDHNVLLRKLRAISLADNTLRWFESYLDRTQVVRYNAVLSKPCQFKYGIPQGSCLGPTLFIFYINDLFKYIDNVEILMFADDCVLYKSGPSWDAIHADLQTNLNVYVRWGREHNLNLNVQKTKAMFICNRAKRDLLGSPAPFNSGDRQILFVSKYCYLGSIIDNEMTMLHEYKAVYRKVEQKVFMLGKLRYLVDKKTAVLIYKQVVLPYLDYAGFLTLSCNVGHRKDLQVLQNNALRICLRYRLADRVRVEVLHSDANLQSVEQRSIFQLLKLMFDYSKNGNNLKLPIRLTRAATKVVFKKPARCTHKFLNSPFYKGTLIWDDLDYNVQRAETLKEFVRQIKHNYRIYVNLLE